MSIRRWMVIGLLVVAAVVGGSASSPGQEGPLTFEDANTKAVNLSGTDVVRVSIRNRSNEPQEVTANLRLVDNFNVSASGAFTILPPSGPIPPSQLGIVTIVRRTETVLPADRTYTGELTVQATGGQAIVMPVQFSPAAPPKAATLQPAVASWAVIADRWWPWDKHTPHNTRLPLKPLPAGSTAPTLNSGEPLAVLTDGQGHRVTVFGELQPLQGSDHHAAPVIKLSFVGLGHPGKYEGEADLVPTDDKLGVVKLSLVQKDQWAFPALVIAAGLFLAWFAQRWAGSRRHLGDLRRRADSANRRLEEHSSFEGLTLQDRARVYNSTVDSLKKLRDGSPVTIDTESEEFKEAVAAVEQLEKAAGVWIPTSMGSALEVLKARLAEVNAEPGTRPPGSTAPKPLFLEKAAALYQGDVTVSEIPSRLADVNAAAEMATRWTNLQRRLDDLDRLLDQLEQRPPQDRAGQRLLATARRLHSGVRWDLWHATDPSDLKRRAALAELDRLDDAIGQLSHRLDEPTRVEVCNQLWNITGTFLTRTDDLLKVHSGLVGGIADDLRAILAKVVSTARSPAVEERRVRLIGTGIVLLAVAVAIWGALVTSYFDEPFGSWRDYLTLFFWGVGTAAALDAINSVVTKVSSPLRKSAPKTTAPATGTAST